MRERPEILAPVGSEEALVAAVRAGANAVYLGTGECNARRNATKFSGESLISAVRYCHARNVKVYVTVNTLLREEELQTAADTLLEIAKAGADAIIVQDPAIIVLRNEVCPDLPMHASTQMAIHNAEGAKIAKEQGFSRVVLARELSYRELEQIRNETDVELEVFVHGALCMSASGMCYLSGALGERSGNRGLCAQPCRLPFQCNGNAYALSLKDMSHVSHLQTLSDLGIASFKIEGRMKRPEYVAASVDAVRRSLEGETVDLGTLRAVFSRSGFTDGYYTGKRTHAMFGIRTQEDADRSKEVLSALKERYRKERSSVPIDVRFVLHTDAPSTLTVSDGTRSVTVSGDVAQPAKTVSLSDQQVMRQLSKTGGTPYFVQSHQVELREGFTLPSSAINGMKREALERLTELRSIAVTYDCKPVTVTVQKQKRTAVPKLRLRFSKAEQAFFAEDTMCILPLRELKEHTEWISPQTAVEVPTIVYPFDTDAVREDLLRLKSLGITMGVAENLGAVRLLEEAGLLVLGGTGLNVTNSKSMEWYRSLGLLDVTASFELPMAKIRDMEASLPFGCIVYGRLPLMQFRACPAKTAVGCGPCDGAPTLSDRTGRTFPLQCNERRFTTLYNSIPLYVADKALPPLDFYTLYFTVESRGEAEDVYRRVKTQSPLDAPHTNGAYYRTLL